MNRKYWDKKVTRHHAEPPFPLRNLENTKELRFLRKKAAASQSHPCEQKHPSFISAFSGFCVIFRPKTPRRILFCEALQNKASSPSSSSGEGKRTAIMAHVLRLASLPRYMRDKVGGTALTRVMRGAEGRKHEGSVTYKKELPPEGRVWVSRCWQVMLREAVAGSWCCCCLSKDSCTGETTLPLK